MIMDPFHGGGGGSGPLDPHVRVCVWWGRGGGELLRCVWGIHVFLLVMERGGRAYHLLSLNSRPDLLSYV